MIVKGPVFSELRKRSLDFYPIDCRYILSNRNTFRNWLITGSYLPQNTSKSEIFFEASGSDLGAFFLREIEFFSNQCFEHLQECLCYENDSRIRSDAWNIITYYYFGLFCVQGLLRLIGKPIFYVPADILAQLRMIFGTHNFPGSGTFFLEKIHDVSATISQYKLKRINKRFHEASWNKLLETLNNIKKTILVSRTSTMANKELLFYEILTNKKPFNIYTDYSWPSSIRNRANYEPGYAYLQVEQKLKGKTKSLLRNWIDCTQDEVLRILKESSAIPLKRKDEYSQHVKLLCNVNISQ